MVTFPGVSLRFGERNQKNKVGEGAYLKGRQEFGTERADIQEGVIPTEITDIKIGEATRGKKESHTEGGKTLVSESAGERNKRHKKGNGAIGKAQV